MAQLLLFALLAFTAVAHQGLHCISLSIIIYPPPIFLHLLMNYTYCIGFHIQRAQKCKHTAIVIYAFKKKTLIELWRQACGTVLLFPLMV